jgi:hypothetical protein
MPKSKTMKPWQVTKSRRRIRAIEKHAPTRTSKTLRNNPDSRGRRSDSRVLETFLWLIFHNKPLREARNYPLTAIKGVGLRGESMHHRIWIWLQSREKDKGLSHMWRAYLQTLSKRDVLAWRDVLLKPAESGAGKLDPHTWMSQLRRHTQWYKLLQSGIRGACRRRGGIMTSR